MDLRRLTCLSLLTWALVTHPATAAGKPSYDKKMQLGQLLYFNGNVDQAVKAFKYAAHLKPQAVEPHLSLVNIYVQKGDIPLALDECEAVLEIKPNHRDVHLILGNLLRSKAGNESDAEKRKELLSKASEHVHKAQELGADEALCQNTLGVIMVQQAEFDKAMEHIDNALKKKNNLPDAHLIKGVLKFKKGDKDEAISELDTAIKQKGKHAEARATKADILFSMGKHDEAHQEYKKATEDDPRYHQAWSGMGNIHIHKKDYESALEHLEKAKAIRPDDKNVLYSIGVCLEKMGKPALAIKAFNEGLLVETDPVMAAQIRMHVHQLQQTNLFNVPSLVNPLDSPAALNPANLGGNVFGESFKDLIKVGGKKKGGDSHSK